MSPKTYDFDLMKNCDKKITTRSVWVTLDLQGEELSFVVRA